MSLFANTRSSVPVDNISFAEDNTVRCSGHQEKINKIHWKYSPFNLHNPFAACSKCTIPFYLDQTFSANCQATPGNQCCVISPVLATKTWGLDQVVTDPPIEFQNLALEHMLWDRESKGYGVKSLVYMGDQQLLAACSLNGNICFWSIGDRVELKGLRVKLEKTINFAKYCVVSEEKKYFVVGTEKGVHIYNMAGGVQFLGIIDEETQVSDLDFLKEENKMITVNDESLAKVWSLETLTTEEKIDLQRFNIKGKIFSVIYMKETNEVAIEHKIGLSIIDWQFRGEDSVKLRVRHHIVAGKKSTGCLHLPQSKRLIHVSNSNTCDVKVLKEENLSELNNYQVSESTLFGPPPGFSMKFVSTKDESKIISNAFGGRFTVYEESGFHKYYLSSIVRMVADVELMEDQYRIAVADQDQGVVFIFRTNSNMKIQRSQNWTEGYYMFPIIPSSVDPNGLGRISLTNSGPSGGSGLLSLANSSGIRNSGLLSSGFSGGLLSRNKTRKISSGKSINSGLTTQPVASSRKKVSKSSKKGKKIKKVEISSREKKNEKASAKKEGAMKKQKVLRGMKHSPSKTLNKKPKKDKEESPIEVVRIRKAQKGGKSKAKEEKVWVVFSEEDDEKTQVKRGRSIEKKKVSKKDQKKGGKRNTTGGEERSRSRSNSKSVTRKSK